MAQAWYDWCFAVSPTNPDLVYWGAVHLYRGSRSGLGWQWENISSRTLGHSIHPDQHHIAFDPSNPKTVYVCNDGGLFRSRDSGIGWDSLNPGLAITEFEFLAQLEAEDTWLIGGTQDNGTLAEGGNGTWNQIALGDGGDCGADDDQKLCYHSYYGMWIERANALGPNAFDWTEVSPPFSGNYDALFYPPMEVCGKMIAKAGSSVFVSEDSGNNWVEIDLPSTAGTGVDVASALAIVGSEVILVGTEQGMMYRLTRAANGWGNARVETLRSPRAGFISDICVPGSPTRTIWASCSAFGGAHVFRSMNGGRTWANRTANLPDIPVNAVAVDTKNTRRVFAATDHGVYRTQDAGVRWSDFSNGLPNVLVGDLILHARRRLLRAGTRNRGAWEVGI